jgi:hypothetical protein
VTTSAEEKRADLSALIALGPVKVVFDPSAPGVLLPEGMATGYSLGLVFGGPGGRRLEVTPLGLTEDVLLAPGRRATVYVPWGAVYQFLPLGPGSPVLYPESVPSRALPGLLAELARGEGPVPRLAPAAALDEALARPGVDLGAIKDAIQAEAEQLLERALEMGRPKRPALRLIRGGAGEGEG